MNADSINDFEMLLNMWGLLNSATVDLCWDYSEQKFLWLLTTCARFKREQQRFHTVYKFCSVLNFKCLLFVITIYLSYLNRRALSKLWLLTVYTYFFALIVYQSYAIAAYLVSQKKHSPLFCSGHLPEYRIATDAMPKAGEGATLGPTCMFHFSLCVSRDCINHCFLCNLSLCWNFHKNHSSVE